MNGERELTTYPAQLDEMRAALAVPPVWPAHAASLASDTAVADIIETLATESDTPTTVAISPRAGRDDLAFVNMSGARAGVRSQP